MRRVLGYLRRTARACEDARTDSQLLERFRKLREESAFEAIVQRHGAMVLGVCRRVLGHEHDAEDAFQATFLILARKAGSMRHGQRLGNWLYGVAYRTSLEARALAARRRTKERQMALEERRTLLKTISHIVGASPKFRMSVEFSMP
jgi:RNA polymerase sigma-70 factor (ECF subfamily)